MNRQQHAEATKLVTEYVIAHPFETQKAVAVRFGLTPNQVHWIVRKANLHKKRGVVPDLIEQGEWRFFPTKSKVEGAGK